MNKFTLELVRIPGLSWFRMREDGSWREIPAADENKELVDGDFVSHDPQEIRDASNLRDHEFESASNELLIIRPSTRTIGQVLGQELTYSSSVFRDEFPKRPQRDQLRSLIEGGDNSKHNTVAVTVDGDFIMRTGNPRGAFHHNDPQIAVRFQSFAAGTDHVGSADPGLVNLVFQHLLHGWVLSFRNRNTQGYRQAVEGAPPVTALESTIDSIQENWEPGFLPPSDWFSWD